jgi:hypothetical protein
VTLVSRQPVGFLYGALPLPRSPAFDLAGHNHENLSSRSSGYAAKPGRCNGLAAGGVPRRRAERRQIEPGHLSEFFTQDSAVFLWRRRNQWAGGCTFDATTLKWTLTPPPNTAPSGHTETLLCPIPSSVGWGQGWSWLPVVTMEIFTAIPWIKPTIFLRWRGGETLRKPFNRSSLPPSAGNSYGPSDETSPRATSWTIYGFPTFSADIKSML